MSDEALRRRAAAAAATAALACFKYARHDADIVAVLGRWTDVLAEVVAAPNGLEALAVVMRYIWLVNDHFRPEALYALLEREVGPDAKETAMTVGQQLIEQGKVEGRLEGRLEGKLEGKLEGRLEGERAILLRLLRQRFGAEFDASAEQRIASASLEQLEAWSLRVLSASSLAELFAD